MKLTRFDRVVVSLLGMVLLYSSISFGSPIDFPSGALIKVKALKGSSLMKDASGLVRDDFEYGTGFGVADFLVMTARHTVVFGGSPSHDVQCWSQDRNRYEACTVVYVSPDHDIAVLWYPQMAKRLLPLRSDTAPPVGTLYAAGFPDVSYARPRLVVSEGQLLSWNTAAPGAEFRKERKDVASVDAIVFPGCSGGPLLTKDSQVVGMVVSAMQNDQGDWDGVTFVVRAAELRKALAVAREAIQKKKGYEFLDPK